MPYNTTITLTPSPNKLRTVVVEGISFRKEDNLRLAITGDLVSITEKDGSRIIEFKDIEIGYEDGEHDIDIYCEVEGKANADLKIEIDVVKNKKHYGHTPKSYLIKYSNNGHLIFITSIPI